MKRPDASPLEVLAGRYLEGPANECWLWHGALTWKGYGAAHWNRESHQAHRLAYLAFIGPIPDGMTVHHTCGERRCINPHHLELLDRAAHGRLHRPAPEGDRCKNGHLLTPANTRITRKKNGSTSRTCRTCDRERHREKYHAARSGA